MVTPTCYSPADVRRYSRMNAYSSYPERRSLAYPIHPDTRTTIMTERDMIDDVTPQRKRIAVARANNRSSVGGVERGRSGAAAILEMGDHAQTARTQATSPASFSELLRKRHP